MNKTQFKERLLTQVLIADGAMGTMLYQQGYFLNCCYDELNLSRPSAVEAIHAAYIDAGADLITTNTFGANSIRLAKFGLADKADAISKAAVAIARRAAQDRILVAGSIGPTGIGAHLNADNRGAVLAAFESQAAVLAGQGADVLLLETFMYLEELLVAIEAAARTPLPLIAQMAVPEPAADCMSRPLGEVFAALAQLECVDALGLNCILGPAEMFDALDLLRNVTTKPLVLQPNAGRPREVDGRVMYVSTPEYMAEYAKRFFEKGVPLIGGCCGTTPDHIGQIARAVKALAKSQQHHVRVKAARPATAPAAPCERTPLEACSPLGRKLAAGQTVYTIEISPPKGFDIAPLLDKVALCKAKGIDAVNIPDGPRASSRLSAGVTALKIQQDVGIEAIVHFCCRDRNLIGIQSDLFGMHLLSLHNVLLITGDPPKLGEFPDATAVYDLDSISLCGVVSGLNAGMDIAANRFSPSTSFTIGVGVNPAAADIGREIDRFAKKVAAGAHYAVTQPVFDPGALLAFLDRTKHLNIPVIAGIWPFTSYKNAEFMANEVPGVSVPGNLLERMKTAASGRDGKRMGAAIARDMIAAIGGRVAGFALSAPFGNVHIPLAVLNLIGDEEIP